MIPLIVRVLAKEKEKREQLSSIVLNINKLTIKYLPIF